MTASFRPRRILVTRMKFIGDVVLTTPVIRSLRHAFPDAYIAYMGDAGAVSLLEQNPHLNEIIPFDFSAPTLLEQPRVAWLLRRRKFDMVIDLFGNPRSALLTRLSGAPVRVGLDRPGRGGSILCVCRMPPGRKRPWSFTSSSCRRSASSPSTIGRRSFFRMMSGVRGRRRWVDVDVSLCFTRVLPGRRRSGRRRGSRGWRRGFRRNRA